MAPLYWRNKQGSLRWNASKVRAANQWAYKKLLGEKLGGYAAKGSWYLANKLDKYLSGPTDRTVGMARTRASSRAPGYAVPPRNIRKARLITRAVGPSQSSRKRKRRFVTRGRYVGAFKRANNKRTFNKFRTLGSTMKLEASGTSVGGTTAEIGHSTCAAQQILKSVGRAILRRLMQKEDKVVSDWTASPTAGSNAYSIYIKYRLTPTAAISTTATHTFTAALSYEGMADELIAEFLKLILNASTEHVFVSIDLQDAAENYTLPLKEARIHYSVVSLLSLQNITKSDTGGTEDHTSMLDIRNNPLVGRVFYTSGNTFLPSGGEGSVGYTGNIALSTNGRLGDMASTMVHPKGPNFYLNAPRSGSVMLQPGEIKKSVLKDVKNVSFNYFMFLYRNWNKNNLAVTTAFDSHMRVGKSRMFHFEHQLDIAGDDPDVTVAYEINLFVNSYLSYKRNREALRIEA
jgi:hypothetical protein